MSSILWSPNHQFIKNATMYSFMKWLQQKKEVNVSDYSMLYQWSVENRAIFWQAITEFFNVHFYNQPSAIIEQDMMPGAQWFPDSTLNYAEHLLRYQHNKPALIFRGENGQRSELSFSNLKQQVMEAQAGLLKAGIMKGDRVAAILPNCIETVVMMLATTALGATWSSCSPDFGVQGIVDRFSQINPKVLIATDGYFYNTKNINCINNIKQVQSSILSVSVTVIVPFANINIADTLKNTVLYKDFLRPQQFIHFEPVNFNHPLFIMYSSGTTGVPKCIVHGHGGTLLQHLKELALHTDVKSNDHIFYFTTCGWMMWNWQISALALGATVVLYDGSPFAARPENLINIVEEERVNIFGTSAKYLSALEKAGVKPNKTHNLSHLRTLLSTGSPLAHESFDYVYRDIKKDICLSSISGGTDIISCFVLGCPLLAVKRGKIQCRGLGMDVQFVNDAGDMLLDKKGELTCQSSFPSMPVSFWNDDQGKKYKTSYFQKIAKVWCHGDYGELSNDGSIIIYGRSDAVLNPGGVRIGTAEIYRQVEKINDVLESIAIDQEWKNDTRVVLFIKLRDQKCLTVTLINKIKSIIRTNTSPRHVPEKIIHVRDIPKTVNGKIVELAVREVVHGRPVANKDALANPEALQYFADLKELSY